MDQKQYYVTRLTFLPQDLKTETDQLNNTQKENNQLMKLL